MTKKQFKEALLRGQGRCIKACQADPDRYFSVVSWACSHTVAFDAQCEGTRAWFVYQLICCYPDRSVFLEAIISSLDKAKSTGGWKMLYLAELLSHFASDGEKQAEEALWHKYRQLYTILLRRKRSPNGIFPERDDFAMLCHILADSKQAMVRIAKDIGNLFQTSSLYDGRDFAWLFESKATQYMATLQKLALRSENVAEYISAGETEQKQQVKPFQPSENKLSPIALSLRLKRKADNETLHQYACEYLAQTDPEKRANALKVFCRCPFPEAPTPIIDDSRSDCEALRDAAWDALRNIRHPLVRALGVACLESDPENALPVFIMNFEEQDETALEKAVYSIPVNFASTTIWHSVQQDILSMKANGVKAPASLLHYIAESTYCSCCRLNALEQLGKKHLLTDVVLEEALFDSNDDIRAYANRCLKRRQKRRN